jgi:hypothetical protein
MALGCPRWRRPQGTRPSAHYWKHGSLTCDPRRHSLEEGKKLREQDPNITQIKGPDEETITPGNWPKTGTHDPNAHAWLVHH